MYESYIHVFWGTVEGESDAKIERSLRRIPMYSPGRHVFDLAYGRLSFPSTSERARGRHIFSICSHTMKLGATAVTFDLGIFVQVFE